MFTESKNKPWKARRYLLCKENKRTVNSRFRANFIVINEILINIKPLLITNKLKLSEVKFSRYVDVILLVFGIPSFVFTMVTAYLISNTFNSVC